MADAMQLESTVPLSRGRPTKFTPERIQQIYNLVERGKSRDEIAEIIGVTMGTLQVTCSKLGISLRRPTFDLGTGLLPRPRAGYYRMASANHRNPKPENAEPGIGTRPEASEVNPEQQQAEAPPAGVRRKTSDDEAPAIFAIRMEYKGQERSTGLPLDEEMISQLALEAEIRGMRIGELVGALILAIVKKDLFQLMRDDAGSQQQAPKGPPSSADGSPPCPQPLGE